MNNYPSLWLKITCEQIYRKQITSRTWRDWLRLCQVPQYSREVGSKQALLLLTLAHLKRENPYKKITLLQIKLKLSSNSYAEVQLVEAMNNAYYTTARGKDLPEIILRITGKQVTLRTLYRWAQKQQVHLKAGETLSRPEVERWIQWATA